MRINFSYEDSRRKVYKIALQNTDNRRSSVLSPFTLQGKISIMLN